MRKPDIKITLVDKIGEGTCHRGHRIGDTFYYNRDRGKICPMVMHVAFPYIDILRYGGHIPSKDGKVRFCCPDVDVINVFELEIVDGEEKK